MDEVQQHAEGVNFDLTIVDEDGVEVDVSAATSRLIFFKKPGGSTVQKTASHVTLGKIRYTSEAGDLDEVGVWSWAGKVTMGGADKPTSVNHFRVKPSLG